MILGHQKMTGISNQATPLSTTKKPLLISEHLLKLVRNHKIPKQQATVAIRQATVLVMEQLATVATELLATVLLAMELQDMAMLATELLATVLLAMELQDM